MQRVEAKAKHLRISPRKIRLVINEVRGLPVAQAQYLLTHMNKKGAGMVLKTLNSAVANATHNNGLDEKTLKVAEIAANEGFTMKRYTPRAFGRATMIRKKTSHLRVVVEGEAAASVKKTTKKAAEKKAGATKTEEKKSETAKKPAAKKKTAAKKSTAKKPAAKKAEAKKETSKK